jgi:hypothetical protein
MPKRNFVPTAAEPVVVAVPLVAVPVASASEPLPREVPVAAPPPPNLKASAPDREPQRTIPGDDALLRAFAATRSRPLVIGDHVHNSECLERGCELLSQQEHRPGFSQYMIAVLAVVAGLIVWPIQYGVVTPLVGLRYAARTSRARGWGVVAVLLGCGIFMSIAYVGMSNVPRIILAPWGVYRARPASRE